jgi:hypothetical protein
METALFVLLAIIAYNTHVCARELKDIANFHYDTIKKDETPPEYL